MSLDGDIVNITASDRIFSTILSDGYTVEFTIDPATLDDDGVILECVVEASNSTFASDMLLLQVLERFSTCNSMNQLRT